MPRERSIIAAYRHAVAEVFDALTPAEREGAATGQRLTYEGSLLTALSILDDKLSGR